MGKTARQNETLVRGRWASERRAGPTCARVAPMLVVSVAGCIELEVTSLPNPEAAFADRAGYDVAISGDTLLSGASWSDALTDEAGKVLFYERDGDAWPFDESVLPTSYADAGGFGSALEIDQDRVIIAAPNAPSLDFGYISGAVHFFERTSGSWSRVAQFWPDPLAPIAGFGQSVSISGDWAAVGAPFADWYGDVFPGTVLLFQREGGDWQPGASLTLPAGENGDGFGQSVSLDGARLLVGAPDELGQGAAYVFERTRSGWSQVARLTAFDAADGDHFGGAVSLSGDVAVIASEDQDEVGEDAGAVYLAERDGATGEWDVTAKLTAYDGTPDDGFGHDVAIDGGDIMVGAWRANNNGAAYAFHRKPSGTVGVVRKYLPGDVYNGGNWADGFGVSVDVDSQCAVIGAPNWNSPEIELAGATYAFCDDTPPEDPGFGVDVDIICCTQPPDPAGPVTFTLQHRPGGDRAEPIERWVELESPVGERRTVTPRATITPRSAAPIGERLEFTMPGGASPGRHALHAYWRDRAGSTRRATSHFEWVEAPARQKR